MDDAPYYGEAFSPITDRCFRVVSRQDGQAGPSGFSFTIAISPSATPSSQTPAVAAAYGT